MTQPSKLQPADEYRIMAQAHLANAPEIRDFLEKCKACGLPTHDREDALNAQCEFCTNFLQQFFPDAAR